MHTKLVLELVEQYITATYKHNGYLSAVFYYDEITQYFEPETLTLFFNVISKTFY